MSKIKIHSNHLYNDVVKYCRNVATMKQIAAHEYINHVFECVNSLDRSGAINIPLKSHRGLISFSDTYPDKTFEQLCDERAEYFLSLNKPIRVYWSGGMDSTGILVSFMKADSNWKDRIEIMTTNSAVTSEHPAFYNRFLSNSNTEIYNICELYEQYMVDTNYINILGIHGSPFPRNVSNEYWRSRIYAYRVMDSLNKDISFDEVKDSIYSKKILAEMEGDLIKFFVDRDVIISQLEAYKNICPVEIKTLSDLQWFLWLSRWGKAYNVCVTRSKTSKIFESIVGFYDAGEFINYSLKNISTLKNHMLPKYPLKKMIYDYDQDENYYLEKQPTPSTSYAGVNQHPKVFFKLVDTDGNEFQTTEKVPEDVIHNILND